MIVGDESVKVINVEDMDKQSTGDVDEAKAYSEINEQLGITVVQLLNKPQGMKLVDYSIEEEIGQAKLFYQYGGKSIRYTIYANDKDSSVGAKAEDEFMEEYIIENSGVKIKVRNFQKPEENDMRRTAIFEYQEVQYELKGIMEKEKFDEMLKNLYFL